MQKTKEIGECPTKHCTEKGKELNIYLDKFKGLYRKFTKYVCQKCRNYYVWPIETLSKKEYLKLTKNEKNNKET